MKVRIEIDVEDETITETLKDAQHERVRERAFLAQTVKDLVDMAATYLGGSNAAKH